MKKDLISIIVPVYNSASYISQCLDSLINQTYSNLEIICVNDGSTDETPDILAQYEQKDSRIKVISIKNGGISNARNTGHKYVAGQYIMYIDSDDWMEAETCEKAMCAAKQHDADVVFWNYIREFEGVSKPQYIYDKHDLVFDNKEEINKLCRKFFGPYEHELANPEKMDSLVTVWGKLYKAELVIDPNVCFVDTKEVVAEDLLFNVHAFANAEKAVYLAQPLNHYRKTNYKSFTKKYDLGFVNRLNNLYCKLCEYIDEHKCDKTYISALNNRRCVNIIGIGMNLLNADTSVNKYKEIRKVLNNPDFMSAIKMLELKCFAVHWKVFFLFAKYRFSLGIYAMLRLIRYLKNK